jgi:hypothetical protein
VEEKNVTKSAITIAALLMISGVAQATEIKSREYRYDYGVAQDAGGDMYVLCTKCSDDKLLAAPMPIISVGFSNDRIEKKPEPSSFVLADANEKKGAQAKTEAAPSISLLGEGAKWSDLTI